MLDSVKRGALILSHKGYVPYHSSEVGEYTMVPVDVLESQRSSLCQGCNKICHLDN
jgi:hypothetical protein